MQKIGQNKTSKEQDRDRIASDVEEYLARGGKIGHYTYRDNALVSWNSKVSAHQMNALMRRLNGKKTRKIEYAEI